MDTRADKALTLTYHRAAERRCSFIEITDPKSHGKPTIVEAENILGKGAYGTVTQFGWSSPVFAVKKPHRPLTICASGNSISDTIRELENEIEFMQTVYPGGTYGMIPFLDNETELDYRLIMPVVEGRNSTHTMDTLPEARTFAYVILNIILELQRIHDLNLVHGDAAPGNIIIEPNRLTAHFIDGAFSRRIGEKIKVFEIKKPEESYMPPERVNVNECHADPSQDVYTICWTIDYLIQQRKKSHPYFADICNAFPCIPAFIKKGLNANPAERPTLKSFIEELQPLLVMEHIKHQLISAPIEDAQRILTDHKENATVEKLLRLGYEFIQLERYELLQALLNFIETLTPNQKSQTVLELYRYTAAQKKAADVSWKHSQSLFSNGRNILKSLDKFGHALNLCKAVNFRDYRLNVDTFNGIKATPKLFELYNKLIANGAMINITLPRGIIQLI